MLKRRVPSIVCVGAREEISFAKALKKGLADCRLLFLLFMVTVSLHEVFHRILQAIFSVFESPQPRVAAAADEVSDVARVVIVVGNNVGCHADDAPLVADRATKHCSTLWSLLFCVFGLLGLWGSLVDVRAAIPTRGAPHDFLALV